jgi:hypothetical protein
MGDSASAYMIFKTETEGSDQFEDLRADAKAILQLICKKKLHGRAWTGYTRLRTVTSGGILLTRSVMNFWANKMQGFIGKTFPLC